MENEIFANWWPVAVTNYYHKRLNHRPCGIDLPVCYSASRRYDALFKARTQHFVLLARYIVSVIYKRRRKR